MAARKAKAKVPAKKKGPVKGPGKKQKIGVVKQGGRIVGRIVPGKVTRPRKVRAVEVAPISGAIAITAPASASGVAQIPAPNLTSVTSLQEVDGAVSPSIGGSFLQ